jgi:hypothetical protein
LAIYCRKVIIKRRCVMASGRYVEDGKAAAYTYMTNADWGLHDEATAKLEKARLEKARAEAAARAAAAPVPAPVVSPEASAGDDPWNDGKGTSGPYWTGSKESAAFLAATVATAASSEPAASSKPDARAEVGAAPV